MIAAEMMNQAWTDVDVRAHRAGQPGEEEPAEPLPAEDDLGDQRAADDAGEVERDHGRHRDERVAQGVHVEHPPRRQSLGPGQPDVVRVQHVQHRGPLVPAPGRVGDQGQRDDRQDRVLDHVDGHVPEAGDPRRVLADGVEHGVADALIEVHGQEILEQDGEHEDRSREEHVGQARGQVVDDAVLPHRADHADDDAEDDGDQGRRDHHLQRDHQAREHLRSDGLAGRGRAEVALEEAGQPRPVPLQQRLVEVQLQAGRRDRGLGDVGVRLQRGQRVTGQRDEQVDQETGDEQEHDPRRDPAGDEGAHGFDLPPGLAAAAWWRLPLADVVALSPGCYCVVLPQSWAFQVKPTLLVFGSRRPAWSTSRTAAAAGTAAGSPCPSTGWCRSGCRSPPTASGRWWPRPG